MPASLELEEAIASEMNSYLLTVPISTVRKILFNGGNYIKLTSQD